MIPNNRKERTVFHFLHVHSSLFTYFTCRLSQFILKKDFFVVQKKTILCVTELLLHEGQGVFHAIV